MNNDQNKGSDILGHKRKEEKLSQNIYKDKIEQKNKKNMIPISSLIKPELNENYNNRKISINLDEKDEIINKKDNIIEKTKNETQIIKICEKCGNKNNVYIFKNNKNIIDYFLNQNIPILFKNELSKEYDNYEYDEPKIICSECLLMQILFHIY